MIDLCPMLIVWGILAGIAAAGLVAAEIVFYIANAYERQEKKRSGKR